MFRIVFVIFVLIHGAIHLLGFLKAFNFAKINQLSGSISKQNGFIWLIAGLLFGVSMVFFLLKNERWWLIGSIAIVISQLIIILFWQDAKYGTIANIIILIICLAGFGAWNFDKMVKSELNSFLPSISIDSSVICNDSISHLPDIIQLWLKRSNVVGKPKPTSVHLLQSGRMKIKPEGAWMKVKAEQWFTTKEPGFIWNADVGSGAFIQFSGRDKLVDSKGSMLIKLFSLVPIVDQGGPEIDQGVMVRYLSEIVWFPAAALSNYITWDELSPLKAKATLECNNLSVSGIFTFNDKGQPLSFEAKRFFGTTGTLETWFIEIDENSEYIFNGQAIPTKANVTWKLKELDFTWYEVEIEELELK